MARISRADENNGEGRNLVVPFACHDGSRVSVTINPRLGVCSEEEAVADAKEAVKQLAASFASDEGRLVARAPRKATQTAGDAVFRSWAFGQ